MVFDFMFLLPDNEHTLSLSWSSGGDLLTILQGQQYVDFAALLVT